MRRYSNFKLPVSGFVVVLLLAAAAAAQSAHDIITMSSPSPLYTVKIMLRSGSADDPAGKEGLANLVAQAIIEGGFGAAKAPITKEKLAEITRPWGSEAMPTVRIDKQTTTFSVTVPKAAFPQFVAAVLKPMLTQPLFEPREIERLRKEELTGIQSRLRFEQQEMLGLQAMESYVFAGTRFQHVPAGTVKGLQAITAADLKAFYQSHYHSAAMFVAASFTDPASLKLLASALPPAGHVAPGAVGTPEKLDGREVLIITQPNAIATGIHIGFPIAVKRGDADYWPLFVANTYLGQHRDEFGRLYQNIRQARGYNYGDYSYIEYLAARPYSLFPPPGTPRSQQYFNIWIRPVGNQYAHFILKAATAELEGFIQQGLTPAQVEEAKVKARTLYLNFAENTSRQLGYRLDDAFYGISGRGYVAEMLTSIEAVTPAQVNAAIRKHLQSANLRYVITTNEKFAAKLADDIATNANATPKTPEEYHIAEPVPPEKQQMLAQDKQWIAYPLNIKRANIHIVKSEQMFETAELPLGKAAQGAAK